MSATEWWQRGPVDGVPDLLQPVAHILLQVQESVHELVAPLTVHDWNARPAGVASIAFHVRHITGVVDRLFTYARGESLTELQFVHLRGESADVVEEAADVVHGGTIDVVPTRAHLLRQLDARIEAAVQELRRVDVSTLAEWRGVGRAQLPSTVIGCLVHGAEHGMRHVGQLSVTARVVQAQRAG